MKTALALIFLVSVSLPQVPEADAQVAPACGPLNAHFEINLNNSVRPEVQAESGKALVYVIEDQKFKPAKDVTARIGLDGTWVGATRGDSYLSFSVDPGEHHLCADWMPSLSGRLVSLSSLTAEAGKVYYFRARTMGGMSGGGVKEHGWFIDLDQISSDEGRYLISRDPLSLSTPKK